MKKELIAPCGMNCGLCFHHSKLTDKCPGCNSGRKVNGRCLNCAIKLCNKRDGQFCFSCQEFPCERIQRLDKRYREKYGMSEIENLNFIRNNSLEALINREEKKWVNKDGTLCVHDNKRYSAYKGKMLNK